MKSVHPIVLALLSAPLFAGCTAQGDAPPPPPTVRPEIQRITLPDVPAGHPDLGSLSVLSRGPRRMSVEQLERSLEQIGQLPAGSVRFPDSLAVTLGRPDYVRLTEESLEPSPLFMKFMLDLGALACRGFGEQDPQRAPAQRVLTRYTDVDQNIDYMLVRFTGIEGPSAAAYHDRLKTAYQSASQSPRGAIAGWEAVCISIFTSPEFLLY